MLCPFTHDKVLKFIKQLKPKGSAGLDAMPEFSNVTGGLIALPLSIILTYPFRQANYQLYGSVLPLPLLSERGQLVILQTTGLFLSPASRASCLNVESKSLFYHIYCTTTSLADISMFLKCKSTSTQLLECNLLHTIRLLDKLWEKLSVQQLHSANTTCDSWADSLSNRLP